jgi:hypothetical protein
MKYPILGLITIIFMSFGACVCADTCGVEGNGMEIYILGRDEYWSFTWASEKTINRKTQRPPVYIEERLNRYSSLGDKRSLDLPQYLLPPDMRLDVPYDVSKDGHMLIGSLYPRNVAVLTPSRDIALIAPDSSRLVKVIKTQYGVESLAWSPTGRYFAVLLSENATSQKWKGPLDWISGFLGHPIPYNTLHIEIYNSDGRFVCRRGLINKLAYGRGFIDWEQKR